MSSDNSHKTQITVALIGVLGALGAGLLANWDKIFPAAKEPAATVSTSNTNPPSHAQPAVTPTLTQDGPTHSPAVRNAQPQHFNGTYIGITTEGMIQTEFQMTFHRRGNSVSGTYIQAGMQGTIQGTVEGETLYYQWNLGGYAGRGQCTILGNKTAGTWGYGMSMNNGGTMVAYLQ